MTSSISATRTCKVCKSPVSGRRLYCSDACKWKSAPRLACSKCGGPTGWRSGRTDIAGATCNSCRSDYSGADHGTRRAYKAGGCRCAECVAWSREAWRRYAQARRSEGRPIKRFGSSGPWINPSVKLAVFERDGWMCQLCGDPLDRDADPNGNLFPSIDHVVPQSKGGGHDPGNLRAAHRWCNAVRQDREVA